MDEIPIMYGGRQIATFDEHSVRFNYHFGAIIILSSKVTNGDELQAIQQKISTYRRKIKKLLTTPKGEE